MQGQRLHLSIYHTGWSAKSTSVPPTLSLPYPSSSPSVFHSQHTHSVPVSSTSDPASPIHLSIHPSSVFNHLSLIHGILLAYPSLCLSLCVSSFPPSSRCLCVRTQLKCPRGPSFKHRNQKHMAHFQLPRSITAIYPEIAAKFPKVSSRFTTDCNMCLSHF